MASVSLIKKKVNYSFRRPGKMMGVENKITGIAQPQPQRRKRDLCTFIVQSQLVKWVVCGS